MPKRNILALKDDYEPLDVGDDVILEGRKKQMTVDQRKEILRLVENSIVTQSGRSASITHHSGQELSINIPGDDSIGNLTIEQRQEILNHIEHGIDASGVEGSDPLRNSSLNLPPRSVTISKSQKNELMLIIGQCLEALVDESVKVKRRHYSKEQKEEIVALMNGCQDEGMSANAAIKYINTIPGYEKVTRKMIREWKLSHEILPRGRKVCAEFENEVLTEISLTTGRNFLTDSLEDLPDAKSISYEDVKIAARNVRERIYEGVGQKWLSHPKTKDLQFSSNWVRKLLRRNMQRVGKEGNPAIMVGDLGSDDSDEDEDREANDQD